MSTYALTVSTADLGIGVIDGARVVVERKRRLVADIFNGQSLSKITAATNSSGIATILLAPDDGSVYHEIKIFDLAGVLVYSSIFAMPPQAVALTELPIADVISASASQAVNAAATATAQAVIATEKAVLTAADRVQTGLDVIATNADAAQTGLDVIATAADRVQTGLDRVQTGLDVITTASARDAALIQAGVYATEAAGRAAVADGQAFKVQGAGDIAAYEYRRVNSGSSTLIATYPMATSTVTSKNSSEILAGELPVLRNIFDKSQALDNYALRATDGAAIAISGFVTTGFIKVLGGGSFVANKNIFGDGGTYGIAFYTLARTFISGSGLFNVKTAGTAISVPTDAAYVRFCVQGVSLKNSLMVVHGSTLPTSFAEHDFIEAYKQRELFTTALSESLRPVPNLFSSSTVTLNTIVNSTTGNTSAATGFFCTDFMRVNPNLTVTCNMTASGLGSIYGWAFFDSSKNYISGVNGPVAANVAVTVPSGAAYTRCSFHMGGNPTIIHSMQIWQGTTAPTNYQKFGYTDSAEVVRKAQDIVKSYLPQDWNLFVKSKVTTAQALLITGVISTSVSYASYCTTDYMPVRPDVPFSANLGLTFGSNLGWIFYDKDYNYLTGVAGNTYTAGTGITPPPAAAFMRTTLLASNISRLKINEGTSTPPTTWGFDDLRALYRYAGKKLSVGGDSIMQTSDGSNVFYLELLNQLKCATGINAAVSGTRMWQIWQSRTNTEFADTDLFIYHFGTNDYFVPGVGALPPTPIGNISDAPATGASASFIAATKYNIQNLLAVNKKMRIMFLAPMQRFGGGGYGSAGTTPNSLGNTLQDYSDAIIAVCALYAIPVLDQGKVNGINEYNQDIYLYDTLHPNPTGYIEKVVPSAVSFINNN